MPINKSEVYKILELDMDGIPAADRERAKQDVADFVKEQMLADLGRGKSPVTGDAFKPLSEAYKQVKKEFSSQLIPNMELHGDLLDALTAETRTGSSIEIGWFDKDQAVKAFNHTTGDTVPKRPLIPGPREDFRPEIMDGISSILEGYRASKSND